MKSPLIASIALVLVMLPFASCNDDDESTGSGSALMTDAGPDQTITQPAPVLLDGSNSMSNLRITSYEWTRAYGPDTFRIENAKAVRTEVYNLASGVHGFALTVRDAAGRVASDTVQVTVNPGGEPLCNNIDRPVVNARLVPIGTLSEARAGMTAVAAGSKILFAGANWSGAGVNGYGSSRVDIFDTATGQWSTARLSEARSAIGAVAAGNKVFFAGGRLHGGGNGAPDVIFSTVDIYDAATGAWSVASLSQPRAFVAAAALGEKVFFAGGERGGDHFPSDRVDIYELSTGQWSTASLSEPRGLAAAVAVGGKVYFAGGFKEDIWNPSFSDRIDVYDGTTGSWSTASLRYPMGYVAGLAVGDDIFWLGGCTMERRNVKTGQISLGQLFKPAFPEFMLNNAVVKDNKLLLFRSGGEDVHRFDIFDLGTGTWSIGVLPQDGIVNKSIIALGNEVYLAGGATLGGSSPTPVNQVWRLEF
ncbi:Kelch repeat-containing protein [Rufibacter psychrotolerans]|uniref:Kelch repeat-containing protein n=1 Tax=Rufibacter psychrotolerans TaxID=2812556 RepID=UPI001967B157|nr:kelch repeat-containing protein [Rufibacter sp. SYSU D00308]